MGAWGCAGVAIDVISRSDRLARLQSDRRLRERQRKEQQREAAHGHEKAARNRRDDGRSVIRPLGLGRGHVAVKAGSGYTQIEIW